MAEMGAPSTVRERDYYNDEMVREQIADQITAVPWGRNAAELYRAFPDDYKCSLPDEGGWIIVKDLPHTNIPNPPLYSIWWAKPIYMARPFPRIRAGKRRRTVHWPMLQARIATEHGDLDLYPVQEFSVTTIEKWLDLIGHGVTPHFVGPAPDDLEQRMFYIRSRGISPQDALLMCLPGLESDGSFVYFTLEV